MIFGTLTYPFTPYYVMPRAKLMGIGVVWWNGSSIVMPGNPSRYHEVVFGGYEVFLRVHSWVWDWSNKSVSIRDWITDLWAYPPGGGTPISFGTAEVYANWQPEARGWFLVVAFAPYTQTRMYQAVPGSPPGFYSPLPPSPVTFPYVVSG